MNQQPSRAEQSDTLQLLKQFAFEQNDDFRTNRSQGMSLEWSSKIIDIDNDDAYVTTLTLGFTACRLSSQKGKPHYEFELYAQASRDIDASQMQLSDTEWEGFLGIVSSDWGVISEEVVDDEGYFEAGLDVRDRSLQIIDDLGLPCEEHQVLRFEYVTYDKQPQLHSTYERYYEADGDTVIGTIKASSDMAGGYFGPYFELDDDAGSANGIDKIEDVSVEDFIFSDIVTPLEEERHASGDFIDHQEKVKQVQWIIRCLRQRSVFHDRCSKETPR